MRTRWDPDGPGWEPGTRGAPVTAFSMACLALALVSFGDLVFLAATLRERAGSVVAPATVERVVDVGRVVARVDGRLMDVQTPTSYDRHTRVRTGRGYVRGSRLEVRHWPGRAEMATDTAGEARLPGTWIFAVAGGGLLLGIAGLLVPARPLRTRSA
ncbi:hypothetical protein ACWEF6_27145 [Amycolatopsis sp. NPDC004772]